MGVPGPMGPQLPNLYNHKCTAKGMLFRNLTVDPANAVPQKVIFIFSFFIFSAGYVFCFCCRTITLFVTVIFT